MNLDTFIGQREIINTLKKALNKPFHAYIFEGERGLGKKTFGNDLFKASFV